MASDSEFTLPDYLRPGLDIVFVGINPGAYSSKVGKYFATPQNRFWPALSRSGIANASRPLVPGDEAWLHEAGIGFTVPLKTKEDDFIGRDALVRAKEHPQRVLVGLDLVGDDIVGTGDPVMIDRQQVGTITSGARSPILRKNIALCRMSIEHSEIGTEVEVGKMDGHQKRLPATVVRFPHYDPDKERVRS